MKVLLRIVGYFGGFLLIMATGIAYGYVSGLAVLGITLVFVAIIEAVTKYGKWEE